ncbi:hypothetical protein DSL72_008745 [Monilinia vaccinii-corymbosi]|uniref:Uncharacterized protein n=1 Tax=Monilinia vaccinii-corymbosi TaxID=61207 RepID=A0A8A3PSB3_9HELO|nr:hypothetical protein DSL72_008745 [Monilinia vaccinii-corymbosi]
MSPDEIDMNSHQRGAKAVLGNDAKIIQSSSAPRQKFVHFAPETIDNEFNVFNITSRDERHTNNIAALDYTNHSERERISSSSELYLSLNQTSSSHHRLVQKKDTKRRIRMDSQAQNDNPSPDHYFRLVAAYTPTQCPPRVPSPPVDRDPPSPPCLERLPTPDFEDVFAHCPKFCDCLGCYEVERSARIIESRGEASGYSKMNDQYQAATAYIRDRRTVSRQQMQDPAVEPMEGSRVYHLMRM